MAATKNSPLSDLPSGQWCVAAKTNSAPAESSVDGSTDPFSRFSPTSHRLDNGPHVNTSIAQNRKREGVNVCPANPSNSSTKLSLSQKLMSTSPVAAPSNPIVTSTMMMNGCDKMSKMRMGYASRANRSSSHRQTDGRDGNVDRRATTSTASARKLLLTVPLQQRKRKTVVYARDFGPTPIEQVVEEAAEGSCVDSVSVNSSTSSVNRLVKMYNSTMTSKGGSIDDDGDRREGGGGGTTNANADVVSTSEFCTNSGARAQMATDLTEPSTQVVDCECCSSELVNTMRTKQCDRSGRLLSSHSPVSDEGCASNVSPYSTSSEDEDSAKPKDLRGMTLKPREKVERSSSSDSALGLDEDILNANEVPAAVAIRRMTLTVTDIPLRSALLPVAEPTSLPDSPTMPASPLPAEWNAGQIPPITVPSKMLLEARIVELPPPPPLPTNINYQNSYYRRFSTNTDLSLSRRESLFSDLSSTAGDETTATRSRYVRTPSVVVSDYSDDIMCGITLEELEFFRRQRKGSIQEYGQEGGDDSDLSAASSCSNLNYCGSTISALDACEIIDSLSGLQTPERKSSSCSTCSNVSGPGDDEVDFSEQLSQALGREKKKVGENARN